MYQAGLGGGGDEARETRKIPPPLSHANSSTPMSPQTLLYFAMQLSPQIQGGPGPNRPRQTLHAQRGQGKKKKEKNKNSKEQITATLTRGAKKEHDKEHKNWKQNNRGNTRKDAS